MTPKFAATQDEDVCHPRTRDGNLPRYLRRSKLRRHLRCCRRQDHDEDRERRHHEDQGWQDG